jgi:Lon-like ATP-dependent protease
VIGWSCLRYVHLLFTRNKLANTLQNIKEGIEGRPVSWYKDVFPIVFPTVDTDIANKLWAKELKSKPGDRKKKEQKRKEEEDKEEEESGEDDD